MKRIYHTGNMASKNVLFFIEFVSVISCVHLKVSNLNCFDDYITTMVCNFTSDKAFNCSGYILDFESPLQEHYACPLVNSKEDADYYLSRCGCTVELPEFVNTEKYIVRLTEGRTVLNSTTVSAIDNIKPRPPKISSVMPMENGNYNVTWNTNYPKNNALSDSLEIHLSYRKKGEPDKASKNATVSPPFHEIHGSDLEPSSDYVVKARSISTYYSTQFSDWSPEVEWTSSASVGSVLKAAIPVLCVLLVVNICALYCCCTRLKAKWWDKIPTPTNEIKDMLPGNSEVFTPKHYDPSSNRTDLLTIDKTEEKLRPATWISECEQDGPYKNVTSQTSAKDSGVFSCDDSHKWSSDSAGSCSSSESGYKNILYTRLSAAPSQDASSQEPLTTGPPFLPAQPAPGCDLCPLYTEVEVPKTSSSDPQKTLPFLELLIEAPAITTDGQHFVTGVPPVEGAGLKCPVSADVQETVLLLKTCVNACGADDGYESFADAVGRAALGQAPFPACSLEPCGEGYQALQTMVDWHSEARKAGGEASVDRPEGPEESTGQEREPSQCPEWGISASITCTSPFIQKSSMESASDPALTTSPIIQIYTDTSYHRV